MKKPKIFEMLQRNMKEVEAERKKRGLGIRVGLILFRCIMTFLSVYAVVIAAVIVVEPSMVSYIGGLANIGSDTSIYLLLAAWLFPSALSTLLLFALVCFVCRGLFVFWKRCADNMLDRHMRKRASADKSSEDVVGIDSSRKKKRRI